MNRLFLVFMISLTSCLQGMQSNIIGISQAMAKESPSNNIVTFVDQKNNSLHVPKDLLIEVQCNYLNDLLAVSKEQDSNGIAINCPIPMDYLRCILNDAQFLKRKMLLGPDDWIKLFKNQVREEYTPIIQIITQLALYSFSMKMVDLFNFYTTIIGKIVSFEQWKKDFGDRLSKEEYSLITSTAFSSPYLQNMCIKVIYNNQDVMHSLSFNSLVTFVDQKNNSLTVPQYLLIEGQCVYLNDLVNAAKKPNNNVVSIDCPIPVDYLRSLLLDAKMLKRNILKVDDVVKHIKNQTLENYTDSIKFIIQLALYSFTMKMEDLFDFYTAIIHKTLLFDQWKENFGCQLSKEEYNLITAAAFPLFARNRVENIQLMNANGLKYSIDQKDINSINSSELNNFIISLSENKDGDKVLPLEVDAALLKLCINNIALYKKGKLTLAQLIKVFKDTIQTKKQWDSTHKLARDLNLSTITNVLSFINYSQMVVDT